MLPWGIFRRKMRMWVMGGQTGSRLPDFGSYDSLFPCKNTPYFRSNVVMLFV